MATIINSGTTALTITPDATGQLTLQANGVTALTANTTGYLNFPYQPTIAGVQWPAFSAYASAGTTVPDSTYTKILFASEDFDTNNCFSSSRFTPNVAGYYQVNANARFGSFTVSSVFLAIYKNGGAYFRGNGSSMNSSGFVYPTISGIVYCNGTTDYIELYAYQNSGSSQTTDDGTVYKFNGVMVRGA
jgi:hypothetical protein